MMSTHLDKASKWAGHCLCHFGTGDRVCIIFEGNKYQEKKTCFPKCVEERDQNCLMESKQLCGKIRIKMYN